ncbi:hypothetical protein BJ741DRAFT_29947 [Chytriomyces cf. hyalinus JEL632]|nr:hypothetical protein BJ741DRAFT_29947 [Chytriomyces cf. hyalinus JEL632]
MSGLASFLGASQSAPSPMFGFISPDVTSNRESSETKNVAQTLAADPTNSFPAIATSSDESLKPAMNGPTAITVIGIVAGLVTVLLIIGGVLWCMRIRRRKLQSQRSPDFSSSDESHHAFMVSATDPPSLSKSNHLECSAADAQGYSKLEPSKVSHQQEGMNMGPAPDNKNSQSLNVYEYTNRFPAMSTERIINAPPYPSFENEPRSQTAIRGTDANLWAMEEAISWVSENGYGCADTVRLMREEEIDGRSLLLLSTHDLQHFLKVDEAKARIRFEAAVSELRRTSATLQNAHSTELPPY